MTIVSKKYYFRNIFRIYMYLMVSDSEAKLCKIGSSIKLSNVSSTVGMGNPSFLVMALKAL